METDGVIGAALAEFEDWLAVSGWRSKEHDCVNQFAHGFLFRRVGQDGRVTEDFHRFSAAD